MSVLKAFCVAFSLYSRVPLPHVTLQERDMRYALCFFPLVGGLIAVLAYAWLALCGSRANDAMIARWCCFAFRSP